MCAGFSGRVGSRTCGPTNAADSEADLPAGQNLVHGGAAAPALNTEPLPWLRSSRLRLENLKQKVGFRCVPLHCLAKGRPPTLGQGSKGHKLMSGI